MLDLEALVSGMHGLAEEVARSADETRQKRKLVLRQVELAARMEGLRDAVDRFGQEMALPVRGLDMHQVHAPSRIDDYTVIATDGSQVEPDYHHLAPWYVINAGCAVFRYGAPPGRERSRLSSHPVLKPPSGTIHAGSGPESDARANAVGMPPAVEIERLKAELSLAIRLLEEEADPGRTVLLLDGPLVQWRMIDTLRRPADKAEILGQFKRLLTLAKAGRIPVAGYISRSRQVQWVTLLRFSLCPKVVSEGELCVACKKSLLRWNEEPKPGDHHYELAGLRDIEVAGDLIGGRAGWRTEVIELRSKAWSEASGSEGAAGFFYLHTGTEVARVELPSWVWEDDQQMRLLCGTLSDQCEVGGGYPMVLAEAHEAAVIRAADRSSFYALIERVLISQRIDESPVSAKAWSKRRPVA